MSLLPKIVPRPTFAALLVGAGFALAVAGCATDSSPRYGYSQPVQVVGPDVYVYYPGYETYYNSTRHLYVYRDGNAWVSRRDPPRAWARDLRVAPSVHLDFHDAPERHHTEVVRTYPRTWKPQPGRNGPPNRGDDKDRHDNDDRRN